VPLRWAMLLLLAGCTATPKLAEPLGPAEMMTCHRLAQFLVCNPTIELAFAYCAPLYPLTTGSSP
jgi:hypothetical protein